MIQIIKMENLTQNETEELIASLLFSNYIKSNGTFNEDSLELLNKLLKYAYLNDYTDIVKLAGDSYILTDSSFAKVVQLVTQISGEKFEDLGLETERILKEVRDIKFN